MPLNVKYAKIKPRTKISQSGDVVVTDVEQRELFFGESQQCLFIKDTSDNLYTIPTLNNSITDDTTTWSSEKIDNESNILTFSTELTSANIGDAVGLSDDNTVSLGVDGGKLIGKLLSVSDSVATVRIRGKISFNYSVTPFVGNSVVLDGEGNVKRAPALESYDPAGGNDSRGIVLSRNTSNLTCEILL